MGEGRLTTPGTGTPASTSRGAGTLTVASILIGLGNYGYSLALTRFLAPEAFASFAAAQGVVLVCGSVANASMPWVVAHVFANTSESHRRREAIWFALVVNAAQGALAATVVVVVTVGFLDAAEVSWAAATAFAVFLLTTPAGAFQGEGRFLALAGIRLSEVLLKVGIGLVLVAVGLGTAGALAAAALAAIVVTAIGTVVVRPYIRPVRHALRLGHLWRRSIGVAGVQGLVAVQGSLDIILVAFLDADAEEAGSYQAAAILGRVPMFLSAAVATAVYASIARRGPSSGSVMAAALRTYGILTVAFLVVVLTAPAMVIQPLFPPEYAAVGTLLPFTALVGAAAGTVNVLTTWYQANARYGICVALQSAGITISMGALLIGSALGGVTGLAVAASVGPILSALLLALSAGSGWLRASWRPTDLAVLALLIPLWWTVRTWPEVWFGLAPAAGCLALQRLLARGRPGTTDDAEAASLAGDAKGAP